MIELSADLGEGAAGEDELWPLLDAANVACGGHAGDEASMREAARRARQLGVRFGAHPSYPDREHFGRRSLSMPREALHDALVAQIAALRAIAEDEGVRLEHVKPHGALYNDAHHDGELASIVIEAMRSVSADLAIVAPAHSRMAAAARDAGTRVIAEAFADRRYLAEGALVSRKDADALLTVDEAAAQAEMLAREGVVIARGGERVVVPFDTICVHADMEGAVARARAIRARLGGRS